MDILTSYNLIIGISLTIIISFLFNGLSKKTNIPAVLMLIVLGIVFQYILKVFGSFNVDFFPILEVLGIFGLIMIVLEAALELELKREKLTPILKSFGVALIGLLASAWIAALIIHTFIPDMTMQSAWLYATPLSILSSAFYAIPAEAKVAGFEMGILLYVIISTSLVMTWGMIKNKEEKVQESGILLEDETTLEIEKNAPIAYINMESQGSQILSIKNDEDKPY